MSRRQDDERGVEWTKWVASRPGTSHQPEGGSAAPSFARQRLQRPILTLVLFLTTAVVIGGGSYALFGTGVPALSADHEAVVDTLELDGAICCILHVEQRGAEYLVVPLLKPAGFLREISNDVSLRIVTLDDESMAEVASLEAPIDSALPRSAAVAGSTLIVPLGISDDDDHGLWLIDVSDPAEPETIGLHEPESFITSVEMIDDETLLAHTRGEFQFLDVTDPEVVGELGTFRQPVGAVQRMTIDTEAGLLHHLEARANSVRIADVSNLEAGNPLGRHVNPSRATSQPEWPSGPVRDAYDFLNRRAPSQHYQDFVIYGNVMYIAASDGGVEVVDVTDATAPDTVDQIQIADGRAVRTAIAEDSLYVLVAEAESRQQIAYSVRRYAVADPAAPELIRVFDRIEAVPGRQVLETGGSHVFLGLYDTVVMIDPER